MTDIEPSVIQRMASHDWCMVEQPALMTVCGLYAHGPDAEHRFISQESNFAKALYRARDLQQMLGGRR